MQLIIESPGLEVNDGMQQLIRSTIGQLAKMYDHITKCVVVLKKATGAYKKNVYIETQIAVSQKTIFASEQAETIDKALLKVREQLVSKLYRYKKQRAEIW